MPAGYHRMGRVLLVRLPSELRPFARTIGAAWQRELGVETVLAQTGPIQGEARHPHVERIVGDSTLTEVVEHGVRYRFDAAEVMFATGNRTERQRIATLVAPGEVVIDLFAGIGYFTLPIARRARPRVVHAVEQNPVAYRFLEENLRINGVADVVHPLLGDNRTVALPTESADRVLLGYLPDSAPWIPRAVSLVRPEGGWLHIHRVVDVRPGLPAATAEIERAVEATGAVRESAGRAREVKPYGPGRSHVVVDLRVRPGRR